MGLWKKVCASPLLAHANIILFLNKMDILESTLKSGVRVQTYVPSYGSNANDLEHVVKCTSITSLGPPFVITPVTDFREKFRAYHVRRRSIACECVLMTLSDRDACRPSNAPFFVMKPRPSYVCHVNSLCSALF